MALNSFRINVVTVITLRYIFSFNSAKLIFKYSFSSDQLLASTIIDMRLLKVFLGFAFLLCLMEPCLLAAKPPLGPPTGLIAEGLGRRIRFVDIS